MLKYQRSGICSHDSYLKKEPPPQKKKRKPTTKRGVPVILQTAGGLVTFPAQIASIHTIVIRRAIRVPTLQDN